jgi:anti-sigma factor RsiW
VPDLSGAGLKFAGGRMLVIDGKPVAEFMYTRTDGPPVALCIARTGVEPAGVQVDRRGEMHLASWQSEGYTFVIAGIMSADAAAAVAERARSQLKT